MEDEEDVCWRCGEAHGYFDRCKKRSVWEVEEPEGRRRVLVWRVREDGKLEAEPVWRDAGDDEDF